MKIREPFNGLSHFIAAFFALIGLIALTAISWGEELKQLSLVVYGASLTLMMMSSAAYHSLHGSPRRLQFLRKIDHSAIFVLIAGTYTPLCFNMFTGFWRGGMLALVWGIAIVGIISKIFIINTPNWFSASIYLGMGWLAVAAMGEITRVMPAGAIAWLVAGGIIFTMGAVVYATKILDFKPGVFGYHEVWHLFVVGGAFCHFMLILLYIAPVPRVL